MFKRPQRTVEKVFVHCSASSNPNVDAAEVDRWHKQNGWAGIGYHYFIKTDGTLEEGRNLETTPAAQKGHNTGSIAICLNGLRRDDFTEAQFTTLRALCREIEQAYEGDITFHGHNEVAAKECPVFDYMTVLNLDLDGYINHG